MVCQSRGIVPDLCARMGQPRQPHNIKRVKELRPNLIDPQGPFYLGGWELFNYLSDITPSDG